MSASIAYQVSRELPLVVEADVIVVGGGPGGIGAAAFAARAGARTVLVERYGVLGGMATVGEVHPFMPNHLGSECLDKPVYAEWLTRMHAYWPPKPVETCPKGRDGSDFHAGPLREISKDAAALAAEDLLAEDGVQLLYHHNLADVIREGDRIDAIVLLSKTGLVAARAKVYVDATGDGDLAARAGCEFEQGGPSGHSQPMTTCFKLSHVDWSRLPARKDLQRLYDQARQQGRVDCPRENVLFFPWFDDDVVHFNTTRVIHHAATDGLDLSEAEILARRQVRQFIDFLRDDVSGFENARLHSMAQHIGVRESRRILGLNYITMDDYRACRKFPDAIARVRYAVDIHNPDGSGTERVAVPENDWYEIPFGCVVARDVTNLTVAGRPISVDHGVHSSMRVMPPAITVGQAAGLGAALAARADGSAHALDGQAIHRQLKQMGANLTDAPASKPAG